MKKYGMSRGRKRFLVVSELAPSRENFEVLKRTFTASSLSRLNT